MSHGMFDKARIPIRQMIMEGALPSKVQRRVYKRRGYSIADDVELGPGAVIDANEVHIGAGTSIGLGTVIRGRSVRIGRRVSIGSMCFFDGRDLVIDDGAVVREQVFVGGPLLPDSLLHLGRRVRIFQTCFLNPSRPLRIGDETGLGGRSSIFTHGSWQSALDGYPVAFAPVTIGRNVWLPWHVFILPGVEIGDNATVGAGSVVNRSIPAGTLAAGVPAKVIREADQWPRRIDVEEQWTLSRSIVAEMLAYFADQGVQVSEQSDERRIAASLEHAGDRWRIALLRTADDAHPDDDVRIELDTPPGLSRPDGLAWFSLREKRRGGPQTRLTVEIEDFFERYGVRFASTDNW